MSPKARPGGEPAIVIFGAAVRPDGTPSPILRRRVEAAARFGARFAAALYVPTGGVGRFGPSEASLMAGMLRDLGVPRAHIVPEETGTDTLSSVRAAAALLRARGHAGPVYAATSAYHLPRCVLLLRIAGLPARPCPPPPEPASRRFARRWFWRLREVPALPWDAALLLAARLAGGLARSRISAALPRRTPGPALARREREKKSSPP